MIKKFNEFGLSEAKKYKHADFVSVPVTVGDLLFDQANAKPGYNYRKVMKIDGEEAEIEVCDYDGRSQGRRHKVPIAEVQKMKDTSHKERHDKSESVNELAHDLETKLGLARIKGGDLGEESVVAELRKSLAKFKTVGTKFSVKSDSVPAGGFSGANSATMSSSRDGVAVSFDYNDVHRGGYYGFDRAFLVQIKIGGALDSKVSSALQRVAAKLLGKYKYATELGSSSVTTSDGTNWSSAMLLAPSKGKSYSTIPALG